MPWNVVTADVVNPRVLNYEIIQNLTSWMNARVGKQNNNITSAVFMCALLWIPWRWRGYATAFGSHFTANIHDRFSATYSATHKFDKAS